MRLEKLLRLLLDARGLDRLLEQLDRRLVLLSLPSELLGVLQRRHAGEVDNNVLREFGRRLVLLIGQRLQLLLKFVGVAHFANSLSTMASKTNMASVRTT